MKRALVVSLLALASVSIAAPAHAAIITYQAVLSAANENPPTGTLGTGFAMVTVDTLADTMRVQVTFSDLSSPNTAAHIHCCVLPPNNTGVATTTPTFTGFPSGTLAGTYDHTFDMSLASSYNPAFVTAWGGVAQANAALFAGLANNMTYLNIHTQNFGGGEIRGFLTAVPEPASLSLLGLGLAGVALRRRRRG